MSALIKCEGRARREVTANSGSHLERRAGTVRNEPAPKTVTVELTAARGRVRGDGYRQKGARYEQTHFHTIEPPSNSETIFVWHRYPHQTSSRVRACQISQAATNDDEPTSIAPAKGAALRGGLGGNHPHSSIRKDC